MQVIKPGPDFGKISRVYDTNRNIGIAVESVGEEKTTILPKSHWREGQSKYAYTFKGFIGHDDVRLITTVQDDKTGSMVKVAVKSLKLGEEYYDDRYKRRMRRRYVENAEDIAIPWPDPVDEVTEGALVTPYDIARERTFFVTDATIPPVPPIALDSLRNKWSRKLKPDLTEDEIARLTPPKMPLTDAKKAYLAEVEMLRQQRQALEDSGEAEKIREKTAELLQKRIAAFQKSKIATEFSA